MPLLDEARTRRPMQISSSFLAVATVCLALAAANAGDGYRLIDMNGHNVKWGLPIPGAGASLSYAVVTGPSASSGINNCRAIAGVSPLLARSGLSSLQFDAELAAAFGMWEGAADIHFFPAKNPAAADLLIAAEAVPDGVAYTDITPVSSGGKKFDRIAKAMVCLNPDQFWSAADGPSAGRTVTDRKSYRLRYVLTHEIGHVLGLDHPSPSGELMSFEYSSTLDGLQPGDIAGIIALYGPSRDRGATPIVALNLAGR